MRVGLIIYGSLQTVSGGYLYDRKLVEHLRHHGDQVEIFSQSWRSGNESIAYARRLADNLSTSFLRSLRLAKIDILLQDELNHPSLFWLNRRLLPAISYPIVSIVHHLRSSEARPAWQNRLYRLIERRYLVSVDGFVCNSAATLDQVTRLVRNGKPSLIARPGGDRWRGAGNVGRRAKPLSETQIEARAYMPGPLRVLFVGNLIPRKGLHTLLAALAQVDSSRWQLEVVGRADVDVRYTAHIHRTIAAMRGGSHVRLAGRLSDAALVEAYRQHHLLAVPSFEGFGIVYLEAMRWGLPVIAATAGAAHEIVTPGWDGFLVPLGDVHALAGTMASLIEDRGRLLSMSLAAKQRYLRHPTWEASMGAAAAWLNNRKNQPGGQ